MIVQEFFRARSHIIKCPFSDSNVISPRFDHNGGTTISKNGDVKVVFSEGAIKNGDLVKFHIATNSYGLFVLSTKAIWLVHTIGL